MLNKEDIDKIETKALRHRRMNDLGAEAPIGYRIFDIIEKEYESFLLLYPLKSENIVGFTRKEEENIQIFINTSFDRGFQNFACAHELYHLIQFKEKEMNNFIVCQNTDVLDTIDERDIMLEELRANYFAAAFLLPREVVFEKFKRVKELNCLEEDFILEILKLQSQYEVPFKTILKRLKELHIIDKDYYEKLKVHENILLDYCRMMDESIEHSIKQLISANHRKYHTFNTPKLAADIYKNNFLSFAKLEDIVQRYDKETKDFNITKPEVKPIDIDFSDFGTGDDDCDEEED